MMPPFAPSMLPHSVTFLPATYTAGARAGLSPAYPTEEPVPAYVETVIGAVSRSEAESMRPVARTDYRVFTNTNPSAALGRELTKDDQVVWNDTGITMNAVGQPQYQGPLWLTQCTRAK